MGNTMEEKLYYITVSEDLIAKDFGATWELSLHYEGHVSRDDPDSQHLLEEVACFAYLTAAIACCFVLMFKGFATSGRIMYYIDDICKKW